MTRRELALLCCLLVGCGDCSCGQEPAAPAAQVAAPLEQDAAAPPAPEEPQQPAEQPKFPKPGWSKVALDQQMPLCVFTDLGEQFRAKFVSEADRQTLRAGRSIAIGVYPGWCVNEGCDDLPSLQCSVERTGNTLVVRSRYWGYRKDGSTCENVVCRPISAGCESPELEAGTYTIQHGERSYELRIPSVLRSPCFGTDVTTLPIPGQ